MTFLAFVDLYSLSTIGLYYIISGIKRECNRTLASFVDLL